MKKLISILVCGLVALSSISQTTFPSTQQIGTPTTLVNSRGGLTSNVAFIVTTFADTMAANVGSYTKSYAGSFIFTTSDTSLWYRAPNAYKWIRASNGNGAGSSSGGGGGGDNIYNTDGELTGNRILSGVGRYLTLRTLSMFKLDDPDSVVITGLPYSRNKSDSILVLDANNRARLMAQKDLVTNTGSTTTILNDSTIIICNSNGVCDTINTGGIINNYYYLDDTTIVVCYPPVQVCDTLPESTPPLPGDSIVCYMTQVCDTFTVSTGFEINGLIFQNGLIKISPRVVEQGGWFNRDTRISGRNQYSFTYDSLNFFAKGILGTGQKIPAYTNSQFLWSPRKAAGRLGVETHGWWVDDSIGVFSFAAGANVTAIAPYSAVVGGTSNYLRGGATAGFIGGGNGHDLRGSRGAILGGQNNYLDANSYTATAVGGIGLFNRSHYSTTTGVYNQTYSFGGSTMGVYNDTTSRAFIGAGKTSAIYADSRMLEVGNGTDIGAGRSNALTVFHRRGQTVIGGYAPLDSSSSLKLVRNDLAFYVNQGNTTQMNAIVAPVDGQLYWNTDSAALCERTGGVWRKVDRSGGGGTESALLNLGSGYRWAVPSSHSVKTFFVDSTMTLDSTTNTNGLTLKSQSIISAGSCTNCNLTYDAYGRIQIASNGSGGTGGFNSNVGSGFRLAIPNTNNIKTLFGAGIVTLDSVSNANAITITATEVDGSISNELQTLAHTSNATSHTATLSNSGGSLQFVEGTGIALATTGTGLDGILTISTTLIDSTTASNGLTETNNLIELGGALTKNTAITTGSFTLSVTTGTALINPFSVTSTTGNGIVSNSTSGIAVFGNATTGVGGQFNNTTGAAALQAYSTDSKAAIMSVEPATTNTVIPVLDLVRFTTGTAANGIGASIDLYVETVTAGGSYLSNQIISKWTDATYATRTSSLVLKGFSSGTNNELAEFMGNKDVVFPGYPSSRNDGAVVPNSTKLVYVDANGKLQVGTAAFATGAGSPNSNIGSGYRWAVPNTNNIKTVFVTSPVTIDSTTNTDALTIGLDTASGKWRSENYYNTVFTPQTRSISTGYGLTGGGNFTANRTFLLDSATVFPQIFGTLAVTTTGTGAASYNSATRTINIPTPTSVTPAALTKVDDTNVTLTLGGTPGTALLQATSITVGWSGTLAATRGGTGTGTTTTGDLLYGTGGNTWSKLGIGSTGQKLTVVGGVPVWRDTAVVPTVTPAALTKVDDSNVTLTLGGTPGTALLQATSITVGWTGDLPFSRFVQGGANTVVTNPTTGTADFTTTSLGASNLLGRGSTGNIAAITVGGILSFSGTVLSATEVDGSVSNELQTLANTSDATSHTVTLSNSGGSIQLVEGAGITLTTSGTGLDGVVTISATAGSTYYNSNIGSGFRLAVPNTNNIKTLFGITNRTTLDSTTNANGITIDISATYPGQNTISTLGTITTGVWESTSVKAGFGGTGITSYTTGDLIYAAGSTTLAKLGVGGPGQTLHVVGGLPAWKDTAVNTPADTVQNYTGLRAYTGNAKFLVNVDSRTGGVFYRVAAGSENGCTLIVAANAVKWQRQFDGVHYKPEFFEIFGYDENGAAYNASTGAGIGSEAEAIDKICKVAGREGVIVYQPNKTYPIDRHVRVVQGQKHIGGIWQRAAPVVTRLVNNEAINSTTIEVVDATGFQAGMSFLIKGAGTTGDYNTTSSGTAGVEFHTITSISGNTLTISGSTYPISKAMLAGDTVITVASMLYRENGILGSSDTSSIVYLENMTFDGNKSANRYFIDYQQPATIGMFGGYVVAQNCTFKNIPGENVYCAGGRFTNCFAYNLEGSVFHGTNNLSTIDSIYQDLYVYNLVADSIGLGDANKQGHSEGTLLTGSTKTMNSVFENCIVKYAGQNNATLKAKPLFSIMTADDGIVSIRGGHYERAAALGAWRGIDSTTAKGKRMVIEGATFVNCNYFEVSGASVRQGNTLDGLLITGNKFVNTRFYFADLSNFEFSNNEVTFDSLRHIRWNETLASGSTGTTWAGLNSNIAFYITAAMDRVTITGNRFSGFVNDTIARCLQLTLDNTVVTKDGASSTNFYYAQNYDISRNQFNGFRYSIGTGISNYTKSTVGWQINDNYVAMGKGSGYAADYTEGIRVPPGAVANNNTVINHHNTTYSWPFVAEGVSANQTQLIGATLTNNKVYGNCQYAYNIAPFDTSPYNVILKNNTRTSGTINGGSVGLANSFRSGNDVMDTNNLPALTAPINPFTHKVRENRSNY